jgi:hypothetical protein
MRKGCWTEYGWNADWWWTSQPGGEGKSHRSISGIKLERFINPSVVNELLPCYLMRIARISRACDASQSCAVAGLQTLADRDRQRSYAGAPEARENAEARANHTRRRAGRGRRKQRKSSLSRVNTCRFTWRTRRIRRLKSIVIFTRDVW